VLGMIIERSTCIHAYERTPVCEHIVMKKMEALVLADSRLECRFNTYIRIPTGKRLVDPGHAYVAGWDFLKGAESMGNARGTAHR